MDRRSRGTAGATAEAERPAAPRPEPPESLQQAAPEAILAWALATFGERVALCTGFQADGMAILDMAWRRDPRLRMFTIDTGRLPPETYDFMEAVRRRYGLALSVVMPAADEVEAMVSRHGVEIAAVRRVGPRVLGAVLGSVAILVGISLTLIRLLGL